MSLVRTVRSVARSHGSVLWVVLMTGQRGASSITLRCFVPLSVHLASHMYGWTLVLSLSVMLLLPAVYCCRYGMQRVVYATPSSHMEMGREYAAHLHLKWYTPKQLFFLDTPQKWHILTVIINDLWGILSWNFTDTFWGHPRPLHLVKSGIIGAL